MSVTFLDIPMLLPVLALVMARVSGLFLTAPVLNSQAIPMRVKAYIALGISLVVLPSMLPVQMAVRSWADLVVGIAAELAVGAVIGFAVNLAFAGLQVGTQVISQQAGLAMARVFNPAFGSMSNVLGNLYYWTVATAFLAAGGLRAMVGALLETYSRLPLLGFHWPESASALAIGAMGGAFELAIRVAWPAVVSLLLAELTLGFVNRTVQQLNILMVGFSIRIAVGLIAAMISMAAAIELTVLLSDDLLEAVRDSLGV